jgi:hypothetical protein
MSHVMAFFKTRTGAAVLFLVGMFVLFYFIREYRERDGATEKPVVEEGETLLGQMSPEENQPAPDQPVTSEWVEENKLSKFRPPTPATRDSVNPMTSKRSTKAAKVALPKLVHFYEAPKDEPKASGTAEPPRVFAPTGTLIPCQLIITVDSSSLETPVVGFVTEDVWHNGNLIVPAGTEVHAFAKRGRVRDRIEVTGTWEFVWQDGRQVKVKGIALDREHDPDKDSYGLTDGSAGIRGKVTKTDEFLEFKLFAATMIGGAARAGEETTETIFGSRPANSLESAGLEGLSTVAERYAKLILDQIEGDGLFVRVPAGTEFYLYTLQVFEPELASVAGLAQGEHPRNSWEPEPTPEAPVHETMLGGRTPPTAADILKRRETLLKQVAAHQNSTQEDRP